MTNPESFADRAGQVWARLTWDGDRLVRLDVGSVAVDGEVIADPLLGAAHHVGATTMSAIDWARPTEIPAIAAPAKLPPHAGGAILNALALLAERAGIPALRYAGPYPTAALYRALLRSFSTTASEAEFTRDALARMATLARDPIAIDFVPAPHERRILPCGHVELRACNDVESIAGTRSTPEGSVESIASPGFAGTRSTPEGSVESIASPGFAGTRSTPEGSVESIERAVLDGIAYEHGGSPARLVDARAELWFGDTRYAHVATLSADGALVEQHPIPACTSPVIGQAFPPALVGAIAALVADAVPAPLAHAAAAWLAARPVCWADLGGRAARVAGDTVEVHAAIWQHVSPYGLGRVALAIAEALVPVVTSGVLTSVTPK